jgi:phage shock protein PspC (stress-responsive transcriptional regulator)
VLFRRPFAPGAIGFRAMTKVPYNGDPFGGAQVAAYIGAQSVMQRLNAVVPGRWRQEFRLIDPPPGAKRLYMACRLIVTLPIGEEDPEAEAVYEDVGEMDSGSRAGLKALYSDARKRAGVAAGIGAYLYTALAPVVLPIGTGDRQVKLIRRSGKADTLALLPGHGAVASPRLRAADEHRGRAPRPGRDPGSRRARAGHGPGRGRRAAVRRARHPSGRRHR